VITFDVLNLERKLRLLVGLRQIRHKRRAYCLMFNHTRPCHAWFAAQWLLLITVRQVLRLRIKKVLRNLVHLLIILFIDNILALVHYAYDGPATICSDWRNIDVPILILNEHHNLITSFHYCLRPRILRLVCNPFNTALDVKAAIIET